MATEPELARGPGGGEWTIRRDGEVIGTVYRLRGRRWKARPYTAPAPAESHATRADAITALLRMTR